MKRALVSILLLFLASTVSAQTAAPVTVPEIRKQRPDAPSNVQELSVTNGQLQEPPSLPLPKSKNVLELAPLTGPFLPPAPPILKDPVIPSPFLGCWEGNPGQFDSVVNSFGVITIGSPGRIVFCYRNDRIEVPEAGIVFDAADWTKNVAAHLGLGVTTATVDTTGISTIIYRITPTQIHARTIVPLISTERIFYFLPVTSRKNLIDEELATLVDAQTVLVQARQEISMPGMQSVRMWHANFHRSNASMASSVAGEPRAR